MPIYYRPIFSGLTKRRIKGVLLLSLFLLGWNVASVAQQDSLKQVDINLNLDSLQENSMSMKIQQNSPVKASIYSAVLPGLGQFYNKKYWKVPIIMGGFAVLIYYIDFNNTEYIKYKRYYRDLLADDPANKSYLDLSIFVSEKWTEEDLENSTYKSKLESSLEDQKDYWKRNRNLLYVGFVVAYIANIVDAAVDAHFKNFDVSDDLSFNFEPVVQPEGLGRSNFVGLQMSITF